MTGRKLRVTYYVLVVGGLTTVRYLSKLTPKPSGYPAMVQELFTQLKGGAGPMYMKGLSIGCAKTARLK